jgi:hypothetical protein
VKRFKGFEAFDMRDQQGQQLTLAACPLQERTIVGQVQNSYGLTQASTSASIPFVYAGCAMSRIAWDSLTGMNY